MRPYLGQSCADFHQIWALEVFHHALTMYGIQNVEMQKKKFCDFITSVFNNNIFSNFFCNPWHSTKEFSHLSTNKELHTQCCQSTFNSSMAFVKWFTQSLTLSFNHVYSGFFVLRGEVSVTACTAVPSANNTAVYPPNWATLKLWEVWGSSSRLAKDFFT